MNKESLQKALNLTRPTLGGTLIQGLDCYLFQPKKVTTFNGAITISTSLDFDFPTKGGITGDVFSKLIHELGDEIELNAPDESTLVVKYGRSKAKFAVQDINLEFLEDLEESGTTTNLPTNVLFAAGLKRCLNSVGGKSAGLAGINLIAKDGVCSMYSGDGYTSSKFSFELEGFKDLKVFLPAAFVENLLFLYNELNTEAESITISEKYIRASFNGGSTTIRSAFYANPVDTELCEMIDDGITEVPDVDMPESFKEALKRCEILAGKDAIISVLFGNDKVKLTAERNVGELVEEIDLAYPLEGKLKIDVRLLRKVIDGCNVIGFNKNYIVLQGSEGFYKYLVSARMD